MKVMKSLLLGTAAGIVAVAGAQAADLPVKAKAVEYVKVCSAYGAGFFYIPGTDMCIKLGGFVRSEWDYNSAASFAPYLNGPNAHDNREQNKLVNRARFREAIDVRQQTAYGTLRAYVGVGWQWTTGDSITAGSGAVAYLDRMFIQFAGFTFGRTASFFDLWNTPDYSYQTNIITSDSGGTGTNLWAYTAQIGQGMSFSISAEDNWMRRAGPVNSDATFLTPSSTAYTQYNRGIRYPDVVANIRVDQSWGSAQVMVAAHDASNLYYGTSTLSSSSNSKNQWGWAAGAGAKINLPWAAGDHMTVQAAYGHGAIRYVAQGAGGFMKYKGLDKVAIGIAADAVYDNDDPEEGQHRSKSWSIYSGVKHNWTPALNSTLYGGYWKIKWGSPWGEEVCEGTSVNQNVCADANADFSFWQIGSRTVWNPVKALDIGVDVMYNKLNTAFDGRVNGTGGLITENVPTGNVGWWQGIIRVQANW